MPSDRPQTPYVPRERGIPTREDRERAVAFLEALGARAGGSDVLDYRWWTELGGLLAEGWRVTPPEGFDG